MADGQPVQQPKPQAQAQPQPLQPQQTQQEGTIIRGRFSVHETASSNAPQPKPTDQPQPNDVLAAAAAELAVPQASAPVKKGRFLVNTTSPTSSSPLTVSPPSGLVLPPAPPTQHQQPRILTPTPIGTGAVNPTPVPQQQPTNRQTVNTSKPDETPALGPHLVKNQSRGRFLVAEVNTPPRIEPRGRLGSTGVIEPRSRAGSTSTASSETANVPPPPPPPAPTQIEPRGRLGSITKSAINKDTLSSQPSANTESNANVPPPPPPPAPPAPPVSSPVPPGDKKPQANEKKIDNVEKQNESNEKDKADGDKEKDGKENGKELKDKENKDKEEKKKKKNVTHVAGRFKVQIFDPESESAPYRRKVAAKDNTKKYKEIIVFKVHDKFTAGHKAEETVDGHEKANGVSPLVLDPAGKVAGGGNRGNVVSPTTPDATGQLPGGKTDAKQATGKTEKQSTKTEKQPVNGGKTDAKQAGGKAEKQSNKAEKQPVTGGKTDAKQATGKTEKQSAKAEKQPVPKQTAGKADGKTTNKNDVKPTAKADGKQVTNASNVPSAKGTTNGATKQTDTANKTGKDVNGNLTTEKIKKNPSISSTSPASKSHVATAKNGHDSGVHETSQNPGSAVVLDSEKIAKALTSIQTQYKRMQEAQQQMLQNQTSLLTLVKSIDMKLNGLMPFSASDSQQNANPAFKKTLQQARTESLAHQETISKHEDHIRLLQEENQRLRLQTQTQQDFNMQQPGLVVHRPQGSQNFFAPQANFQPSPPPTSTTPQTRHA
eukprot:m.177781 g.177781  ORF g.177781 m.177781 type:complete len:770 (-) comp15457_c0_seq1:193-2502(-)